jgi:hypothetical protein
MKGGNAEIRNQEAKKLTNNEDTLEMCKRTRKLLTVWHMH